MLNYSKLYMIHVLIFSSIKGVLFFVGMYFFGLCGKMYSNIE